MKAQNLRIYVVDDNVFALAAITREIELNLGCRVSAFSSAEECLWYVKNNPPDIILSDYYLDSDYSRKMNADQMLSQIKKEHSSIPVIMYSSDNSRELALRMLQEGASDFILREGNFFSRITRTLAKQIQILNMRYVERFGMNIIYGALSLFLAIMLLVYAINPSYLPFVLLSIFSILLVCGLYYTFKDILPDEKMKRKNDRQPNIYAGNALQ